MKLIWIWLREDGERPCTLQVGSPPRGPGSVYEVRGETRKVDAVRAVQRFLAPEPDEEQDPQGWLDWRAAQRAVRLVDVAKEVIGG